jgi:hypothetical protein
MQSFNLKTPEGITQFAAASQRAAITLAQGAADELKTRVALVDGNGWTMRQFDPKQA